MPEKTCEICSKKILLHENLSGLVFRDEIFVCKDCINKHSQEEIRSFSKTIMQNPENGMPIGLWLIHEQNKYKTMMTFKRSD